MSYLITGGAGFIGSHLCDVLTTAGHRVTVLDDLSTGKRENLPAGVTLIEGDAADPKTVARALEKAGDLSGIFHLAAIASVELSRTQWEKTTQANLQASVNVFAAAARTEKKVPVVYASSAAIYGDCDKLPITEDTPANPQTAYGVDKYASELHARVASTVHGVPTVGMRFFNVYGPRQDPQSPYSGVIAIFSGRLAAGQGITIFGDGRQSRDFIYVGDVVVHLMAAMDKLQTKTPLPPSALNVCTGKSTNLLELAAVLGKLLGKIPDITHADPRAGDIRASLGNPARATSILNVSAQIPLEEGLGRLLNEK